MKFIFALLTLATAVFAANPYLDLKDDQPVTTTYTGKEWGDEIQAPTEEGIDFSAKVTMTRTAAMSWGQIVKVTFEPKGTRNISPIFLLVTDKEILLLNSEDTDKEIKATSELKEQPKFARGDVLALSSGSLKFTEAPWAVAVTTTKAGQCTYLSSHNSGHFSKYVWKKGAGLVEISHNQGARQDGFSLKKK